MGHVKTTEIVGIKAVSINKNQLLIFIYLVFGLSVLQAYGQPAPSSQPDSSSPETVLFLTIPSVYGASKHEQKVTEAPASVSIVTADEIRKYGYRTLMDILRSVRGFYSTYDRSYTYSAIRGFGRPGDYNTRILVLIDGFRANEMVFDYAGVGNDFLVDVDTIKRVEVIRGPASSLYGTSAFCGLVNIITKRGRDLAGLEVSSERASFDTHKSRIAYGDRFQSGVEMSLFASIMDSGGQDLFFQEFTDINDGIVKNSDYARSRSFLGRLAFKDFSFDARYNSAKKGNPTASYETVFGDSRSNTIEALWQVGMTYNHLFNNHLSLRARLFYDHYGYAGEYVYDYSDEGDLSYLVINQDEARGKRWGTAIDLVHSIGAHQLTFGTEFRDNFRLDQFNFDEEIYLDERRDSQVWGAYIQDEFRLHEKVMINAGVRHDHYRFDTSTDSTNPRLALIYDSTELTTIKVLYGRAFRAPNAYELYYNDGGDIQKPSLNLKPETINSAEVVVEHYLGNNLLASMSLYRNSIKNLISLTTDPEDEVLVFRNAESIHARGMDLEVEGQWSNGLRARVSYTFQEARNQMTGNLLSNSPKHLTKFNLILPFLDHRLFAAMEGQYTSNRKTLLRNDSGAFFVGNLSLSYRLNPTWSVSASAYNLFNKRYGDPGSEEHRQDLIFQDGRNLRVKLSYHFGR